MVDPVTAAERMTRSRRVVDALVNAGRSHAAQRNIGSSASLVGAAATVSRRRHTGCFASPAIEAELSRLSHHLHGARAAEPEPPVRRAQTSVLHVMTRCYGAGGHTRLVEQLIRSEPDVVASVALTGGADQHLPTGLIAAVDESGGTVHDLRGDALERARRLHLLTRDVSRIMLSIHENDIVPLLALAGVRQRPPVVFVNHAEHVFWTGAALADLVVCLRPASTDLAVRRRGIPSEKCIEVPLPVSRRTRRNTSADARRALGIDPNDKVLLTVGWRYKFTPFAGDDIIATLAPILEEPDVHLIAVGPRDDDALWSAACAGYAGRVHATGRQADIQPFLDAADVFVDSYPVASLTAVLEAAMFGLPVVGLAPRRAEWPAILREDDPALAGAMFADVAAFRSRIHALLRDPATTADAAASVQKRVLQHHGQDRWPESAQRVRDAVARTERDGRTHRALPPLGAAGVEDAVLATYIADCEDRLVRPELRLGGSSHDLLGTRLDRVDAGLAAIDSLLLKPASPSDGEYDEALRVAQELGPRRPRLRDRLLAAR